MQISDSHSFSDGLVGVWIDQEEIYLTAKDSYADPVELSLEDARSLAAVLLKMADRLEAMGN